MDKISFANIATNYEGMLALIMAVSVLVIPFLAAKLLTRFSTFKEIAQLNQAVVDEKSQKAYWVKNQAWNRRWGGLFIAIIFAAIIPFVITSESQPWWSYPLDIFVILMVYDFFYYLTHRFAFHGGGRLQLIHAVHHQQKNPCRMDSSYIHPLEVAIGLGLYIGSVILLSLVMGKFHIVTLILTWITFSEINLHNHDRQESDKAPFGYLKYVADMHHVHHSRFTSGNYATITLLYDWMFGTLDHGNGWRKKNA